MTYTESKDLHTVDWRDFLNIPFEKQVLQGLELAYSKSKAWVTCACGAQDVEIPRDAYGEPEDWELADLGLRFNSHIQQMGDAYLRRNKEEFLYQQIKAKQCLESIQKRAIFLLEEMKEFNLNKPQNNN